MSKNYRTYLEKLCDIFVKGMGYIGEKLWNYRAKLWEILGKNYGYIMCSWQKPWDIFDKTMEYIGQNYGIYWAKL